MGISDGLGSVGTYYCKSLPARKTRMKVFLPARAKRAAGARPSFRSGTERSNQIFASFELSNHITRKCNRGYLVSSLAKLCVRPEGKLAHVRHSSPRP